MGAIRDGELASADVVLNNCVGTPFKSMAQLLYNSSLIGFNSKLNVTGVPNLKNIKYDVMTSDSASSKTGWVYDATNDYYLPDYIDEASVDTTSDPDSFTNPAYAFDGDDDTYAEKINCGTCSLGKTFSEKYVGSVGIKMAGDLKIYASSSGKYNGSFTMKLQTYNGSTWADHTTLLGHSFSDSFPGGGSTITVANLSYNNMGTNILINDEIQGIRLILSATTNYGSFAGSSVKIYSLEYGSFSSTGTLIFQTTSLPTITDCIPTWNASIDPDNKLTVSISADGTNYEEVTDATIHRFTNTGTNLYVKFEIDRVNTSAVDKISEYAILYNCTNDV